MKRYTRTDNQPFVVDAAITDIQGNLLVDKLTRNKLNYNGTNILKNDNILTFNQIDVYVSDTSLYTYIVYNDAQYQFNNKNVTEIAFISETLNKTKLIKINNENIVTYAEQDKVTRSELDQDISGKLDKVTTINVVYATDVDGNQTTIKYSNERDNTKLANSIPVRDELGNLFVYSYPVDSNHATSKTYVDKSIDVIENVVKNKYSKPVDGIPKEDLASDIQTSLGKADNAITSSEKGVANGVAELDANGKVPQSQLPSYVDDVLEYSTKSKFPTTGESGKIYVSTDNNKTWRWSGSAYVEISPSIVVGTTTGTALDGKVGTDHINNTTVHITSSERTTWNGKQNACYYIITESDVTVTTDSTKGVAPYNTSYGYTNITINNTSVKWTEGAMYYFIINTSMVVGSDFRNVRVRLGTSGSWIPVYFGSSIAAGNSYFSKSYNTICTYKNTYQSSGALHIVSDNNTTYSAMSQSEATTGTATSSRLITAKVLNDTINNKISGKVDKVDGKGLIGTAQEQFVNSEYDLIETEGKIVHKADNDKVLYNLLPFDTYSDNGDGTTTIYRKTGVVDLGTLGMTISTFDGGAYKKIDNIKASTLNLKLIGFNAVSKSSVGSLSANEMAVDSSQYFIIKSTNPSGTLYYELDTPYTEVVNTGFKNTKVDEFVRDEYEKTLNIYDGLTSIDTSTSTNIYLENGKTYYFSYKGSTNPIVRWIIRDLDYGIVDADNGTSFTFNHPSGIYRFNVLNSIGFINLSTDGHNICLSTVNSFHTYNGAIVHQKTLEYFLKEVNTGIKWINGKDIYKKTVYLTSISANDNTNLITENVSEIINTHYTYTYPANSWRIVNHNMYVYKSSVNYIVLFNENDYQATGVYVTVYYTK